MMKRKFQLQSLKLKKMKQLPPPTNWNKLQIIFLAFLVLTFFVQFSCMKTDSITVNEKSLSLKAPSGELVASSIDELKSQTSKIIVQKFGRESNFEIKE